MNNSRGVFPVMFDLSLISHIECRKQFERQNSMNLM